MNASSSQSVLVLGAAGLIGSFISADLARRGIPVTAVARRFTSAQRHGLGASIREVPITGLTPPELTRLLQESGAGAVVNCIGILQDHPGGSTYDVHEAFVERLIIALRAVTRPVLLVHISIPGAEAADRTSFSHSKRNAERRIIDSGLPCAILRPGFVIAPAAYGGGAMLRSLAALPVDLPSSFGRRPLSYVAVEDIAETVTILAEGWSRPGCACAVKWDLMHPDNCSIGDTIAGLRLWLGDIFPLHVRLPKPLLDLGAKAGDLVAWLGWRPPIRSTALAELERGVEGDPRPWIQATGIAPRSLETIFRERPANVQEKWFARLYLLKALVIVSLVAFWCLSGLIALTVAYKDAVALLTSHAIPEGWANAMTIVSSAIDISVGFAIAFRRTCRFALLTGVVISIGYMGGTAILTPELWIEPLGALVKTGPTIVLMLTALAILDDR